MNWIELFITKHSFCFVPPHFSYESLLTSYSEASRRNLMEIPAEYEKSPAAAFPSPLPVTREALRAAEPLRRRSDLLAIVSSQSAAKYLMGTFLLRHCAIHCNRRLQQRRSQAAAGKLLMASGYSLPTMTQQPGVQTPPALSALQATLGSQLNLQRQRKVWTAAKTAAS